MNKKESPSIKIHEILNIGSVSRLDLLTPQDPYSVLLPPVLPTGQSDGRFNNRSPRFNPRFIKSAGTAMAKISKTPILNLPPKLFSVFSRDIFKKYDMYFAMINVS